MQLSVSLNGEYSYKAKQLYNLLTVQINVQDTLFFCQYSPLQTHEIRKCWNTTAYISFRRFKWQLDAILILSLSCIVVVYGNLNSVNLIFL